MWLWLQSAAAAVVNADDGCGAWVSDGLLSWEGRRGASWLRTCQSAPEERTKPVCSATAWTYTRTSEGAVLAADTVSENTHSQIVTHCGTLGITASQAYTYDNTGRLTQVQGTGADAICTTRSYTFDKNRNRKALATAVAGVGLDYTITGAITISSTYDGADRLVDYRLHVRQPGPHHRPARQHPRLLQQRPRPAADRTQRQTWTLALPRLDHRDQHLRHLDPSLAVRALCSLLEYAVSRPPRTATCQPTFFTCSPPSWPLASLTKTPPPRLASGCRSCTAGPPPSPPPIPSSTPSTPTGLPRPELGQRRGPRGVEGVSVTLCKSSGVTWC